MKTAFLQRQLDIVASVLLGDTSRFLRPRLILDENASTASTPGHAWVRLPAVFLGETPDTRPDVFVGLLAHEIGHWLQPIKAIEEAEKSTGLSHSIVNILLDIHGEARVASIFPFFRRHLTATRGLVKKQKADDYRKSLQSKDFPESAVSLLFLGRYAGDNQTSFANLLDVWKHLRPHPFRRRLLELFKMARMAMYTNDGDWPTFLQSIAQAFPELCHIDPPIPEPVSTSSGGEGLDEIRANAALPLAGQAPGNDNSNDDMEATPEGIRPASADVLRLARRLTVRWTRPRSAASIPGPGRLNRLDALRGAPVPFYLRINQAGKSAEQTRVVLAVDWSGSMSGNPWQSALQAAQAVCLGIRANQGDVRALFFADAFWHAPDYSADALFASSLEIDLQDANGANTSFCWLPTVWHAFPSHQVVLLTDGAGTIPKAVFPAWKRRTSAILLTSHLPKSVKIEAQQNIDCIAASSVQITSLDDLPAVWATLIPRKWIA